MLESKKMVMLEEERRFKEMDRMALQEAKQQERAQEMADRALPQMQFKMH
jgi:hypothetical protein